MPEARRTLVKSPPELWAEVSDPKALAKHLEAFGEISITHLDPESTVAWEGDRARGTVELTASGWGTKVRLTAEPVEVAVTEAPEEEPAPPVPEPEPIAEEPEPAAREPEPVAEAPAPVAPAPPRPEKRRGFFARLFARRGELRVTTDASELATPVAEEPVVDEPAVEEPAVEEPAVEEPAVAEPAAEVAPPEPDPEDEIRVARLGEDEAAKVLDGVLDTLGSAHHRPFSRG